MKFIYYFVTHSNEYLKDSFHAYQTYFINQNHLMHSLLITLGIALFLAVLFYFVFGNSVKFKSLVSPASWWFMLLLTASVAFFATGATNGLKSSKSDHSLKYILDKKIRETDPDIPLVEKARYPEYKAMKEKFAKGMFHVKPVLYMALTNLVLGVLFFWIFSLVFRAIIPDGNMAKGSPRYLKN